MATNLDFRAPGRRDRDIVLCKFFQKANGTLKTSNPLINHQPLNLQLVSANYRQSWAQVGTKPRQLSRQRVAAIRESRACRC